MTYRITFILRCALITKTRVVAIRLCEEYLGKNILLLLNCDLSRTTVWKQTFSTFGYGADH